MTTTLDGPADTRTMRIVHQAMRRDLARARAALSDDLAPDGRQRHAIAAHLTWMMAMLHHHHEGEDAGLYPMVRQRNADAVALLDAMDSEHRAIGDGMTALEQAAAAYASDPTAAPDVVSAIDGLESTLLPHLTREEDVMMPVVATTITQREWAAWDNEYYVKPLAPQALAKNGLWIIDGLPPEDEAIVAALVGSVPRWLIRHLGTPLYRRFAFRIWRLPEHSPLRLRLGTRVIVSTPAAPEAVWAVLADPTRIGDWSHECLGAQWLDGAHEAALGARFRGQNRSGRFGWSRPCTITHLAPGRSLGWRTDGTLGDSTEWRVDLEPEGPDIGGGTRIVQQYRVLSMPVLLDRLIWLAMPQHHDRESALRSDLERLGEVAARAPTSHSESNAQ